MENNKLRIIWQHFYKYRTLKNKRKLVEHYYPLVKKISVSLSRKLNYKVSADELASLGVDGLYRAIELFDLERGIKFETYAYTRIKGSMYDGLRKEDWVPRSVRIRQSNIDKSRQSLEADTGDKADFLKILDNIGLNEKDFHSNVSKFKAKSVSSIEFCVNNDIDENKKDFNKYLESKKDASPGNQLIRKEFLNKLIGKNFTSIEKKIICYYYYDGLTMKSIASKLKISESRISQMHQHVLVKLKKRIELNPTYFSDDILDIMETNDSNFLFG